MKFMNLPLSYKFNTKLHSFFFSQCYLQYFWNKHKQNDHPNIYFSWNFCSKKHIKIYILMFHTLLYNLTRSDEKHKKYIRFLDFNVKRDYCSCIILISHFVLQWFFLHAFYLDSSIYVYSWRLGCFGKI
jgi:hypothetical protein